MKTSKWLVAYALGQLGRPYWYGCFGQTADASLLKEKRNQYPDYYDQSKYNVKFTDQFGQKVHDCSGLIKGAQFCDSIDGAPKYDSKYDFSANGMITKACSKTGEIKSIPNVPGLIVWKNNHVGIYLGDGKVCEARGHDWGVVVTDLKDRGWQKWGQLNFFSYEEPKPTPDTACTPTLPVLRKGSKGEAVKSLQVLLNHLGVKDQNGNKLEVDGSFGSKTEWAVKDFQARHGLTIDGIVGSKSWQMIIGG